MSYPDTLARLESQVAQLQDARMQEARESDRLRADIVVKARLLTAQTKEIGRLLKVHDEALGIIYDLLGLEPGSSERAMKFIDDHSPTAEDVKGILPIPSSDRGSNDLTKSTTD